MLAQLDHPNIVRFFGVSHAERRVYIVTEYCPLGSLNVWLEKGTFPAASFYPCAVQLMQTLHWLHEVGVVHRDIKPHNILMASDTSIKICDLGTCRSQADKGMTMTANVGTISYTPPEVMSAHRAVYDGRKWDVYSSSLCLYYMFTGTRPFGEKSNFLIISGVAGGNGLRPDYVDCGMPDVLWDLIESMWAENPDDRPLADSAARTLLQVAGANPNGGEGGQGWGSSKTTAMVKGSTGSSNSDWTKVFDDNHQCYYYFNERTGDTTWERPSGFVEDASGVSSPEMHYNPMPG